MFAVIWYCATGVLRNTKYVLQMSFFRLSKITNFVQHFVQIYNSRPNFVKNCEFCFFSAEMLNAKFRDFVPFSSKRIFCCVLDSAGRHILQ